jgi:hypothetical protein
VQAVVVNYPSLVSVFNEENSAKGLAYHHVQVFESKIGCAGTWERNMEVLGPDSDLRPSRTSTVERRRGFTSVKSKGDTSVLGALGQGLQRRGIHLY